MKNTITLYRDGIREKFVFPVDKIAYVKFNDKLLLLLLELKQSFLTFHLLTVEEMNMMKLKTIFSKH